MWSTTSLWFDIAIVSLIFALGNIIFGHFEERTPKWKRVGKYLLFVVVIATLSFYFGRMAAMLTLALFLIPFLYVHAYYLPVKKGINGLTGEPKSKYYEFRKWNKDVFGNG